MLTALMLATLLSNTMALVEKAEPPSHYVAYDVGIPSKPFAVRTTPWSPLLDRTVAPEYVAGRHAPQTADALPKECGWVERTITG